MVVVSAAAPGGYTTTTTHEVFLFFSAGYLRLAWIQDPVWGIYEIQAFLSRRQAFWQ